MNSRGAERPAEHRTRVTDTSDPGRDVRGTIHRLNNQLAVILAHAELIEAKAADQAQRARAMQVVTATLQAMSLTREIRSTLGEAN